MILHFQGSVEKPEDRHAWTNKINLKLFNLERAIFLQGFHKAFGVDVFTTARKCGFEIDVLKEYSQKMNRFGILLIE